MEERNQMLSRLTKFISTRVGMGVGVVVVVVIVGAVVALAGSGTSKHTQTNAANTGTTQLAVGPTSTTKTALHKSHKKAASHKKGSTSAAKGNGSSSGGSSGGGSGGSGSGCSTGAPSGGTGQLVIYGNSPSPQFKPVLDAFAKAYPSINVNYTDVDDNVAFSKYRAEHAQGARTADIVMESSPLQWNNNKDIALCWTPTDMSAYPGFVQQFPGVLIVSPDPAVSLYSKAKLPANAVPTSFAQLESDLKRHPDLFRKKIATYSVNNQFGYSAFWGLGAKRGWSDMNILGPASKPQADGTAIAQQLASGASNYAFFESGLVRGAITGAVSQIVGWTYMHDFTPLIPRGVAITKGASNPTAAKTFLNWIYSTAGQQVMCAAGFTAFRSGVSCSNSLASIEQAVGSANVYLVPFHSSIASDYSSFTARWHQLFG
jgi:iron(III) transport system substrate-binding protein